MSQLPRYLYQNGFSEFSTALEKLPHEKMTLQEGEPLWELGSGITHVHYIESGLAAVTLVHESGGRKLLYFVGEGAVFPGCHLTDFKLERSIEVRVLIPLTALKFDRAVFHEAVFSDKRLAEMMLEEYARWINLHLFEAAHQERNSLMVKLCNLLYLMYCAIDPTDRLMITQADIANILSASRESVSRRLNQLERHGIVKLGRSWLEVVDLEALHRLCTYETAAD